MSRVVALLNPLPLALRHYVDELRTSCRGFDLQEVPGDGVEVAAGGPLPLRALRHARRVHAVRRRAPLLVVWPATGHLEPLLLAGRRAALVVHDPSPLSRGLGHSAVSRRVGAATARRTGLTVVAHSRRAADELEAIGYPRVVLLPHPVRLVEPDPAAVPGEQTVVRVLGQCKDTRDLGLLSRLGAVLRDAGLRTEVVGRGWPDLPGWDVTDAFVSEERFDELVRTSAVVLLPYSGYYQSGVAVRATEHRVPVVGPAGGHLSELLGDDHPGLVRRPDDAQEWSRAVRAVVSAGPLVEQLAQQAADTATERWTAFLEEWA